MSTRNFPRRSAILAALLAAAVILAAPAGAAQKNSTAHSKALAKQQAAHAEHVAAAQKKAAALKAAAKTDMPKTASEAVRELQHTPEGAVRAFLVSMITPDPAALQQVILPVSADDFNMLVAHSPLSPDSRKAVVGRITDMPLKPLAAGDKITLPNNKTFTVQKSDVNPDHVLLQIPGGPIPVLVERIHGAWFVNAGPIIAARRETVHQQVIYAKKQAEIAAKEAQKAADKKKGK